MELLFVLPHDLLDGGHLQLELSAVEHLVLKDEHAQAEQHMGQPTCKHHGVRQLHGFELLDHNVISDDGKDHHHHHGEHDALLDKVEPLAPDAGNKT